jgi:hypothetical protein
MKRDSMHIRTIWDKQLYKRREIDVTTIMKLCFAWDGDLESLKIFTQNVLRLAGLWTLPGGDKKVFTSDFVSLKWFNKNKKELHVEGNNAREVVLKLLRLIDGEYGEVQSTADAGACCIAMLLP